MAKKCEVLLEGACDSGSCPAWCSKTYSGQGTCVQAGGDPVHPIRCLCTYDSDTSPCID